MKITCQDITKSYSKNIINNVIDRLSFDLASGESMAISGPSGVGKSTLLNLLSGLDNVDKGKIWFDDVELTRMPNKEKIFFRLNNISLIFQTPNLLKDFNVIENIMIPIRYKGISKIKSIDIGDRVLKEVGLFDIREKPISLLSGGEAQRVGIARAMAMESKIILADEPTGNLDTENSKLVMNHLIDICKKHSTTLIVVTHDKEVISQLNNVVQMKDGIFI
ncbi:MAG: ABC transporter ATP-binding protein [Gammaproteobacteria bacterium]